MKPILIESVIATAKLVYVISKELRSDPNYFVDYSYEGKKKKTKINEYKNLLEQLQYYLNNVSEMGYVSEGEI